MEIAKTVLGHPVKVEGEGPRFKIMIDIPWYKGMAHWMAYGAEEKQAILDCINDDKVFFLSEAKTPHAMTKAYHLVGVAICRRFK